MTTINRGLTITRETVSLRAVGVANPIEAAMDEGLAAFSGAEGLAIGEIAGRDSIAAIVKACEAGGIKSILPTAAYAGTEYGDWNASHRNTEVLREILGDRVRVIHLVSLSSLELWAALNSRYATVIYRRYGSFSPCLACHLYMHLCRVPLSLRLGRPPIISGERDTHQGALKLSQLPSSLDAFKKVLAYAGIELLLPIRDITDNVEIERLVGRDWRQGQRQLRCLLSGNYYGLNNNVSYDVKMHERYLREFLIPSGKAIIDAWTNRRIDPTTIDYNAIIRGIVEKIEGVET